MEILSEHTCRAGSRGTSSPGGTASSAATRPSSTSSTRCSTSTPSGCGRRGDMPWRRPIASLNYLLTSHVWRQDHNGLSHQDPGFIDHVVNKKAEVIRVYLPPDANTLLSVADHCLRSRDYVNVIVAGKQPALQYLTMDAAIVHCTKGIGIWDWASTDLGESPDVVLACAGDVPTQEALAAVDILLRVLPRPEGALRQRRRPHAAAGRAGAPARPLGRRVRRAVHPGPAGDLRLPRLPLADPPPHLPAQEPQQPARARVQGGGHDDHPVRHVRDQRARPVPPGDRRRSTGCRSWATRAAHCRQQLQDKLIRHRQYVRTHGEDLPEVRDWQWSR